MTLIIVSNRLPFSINHEGEIIQSSGGLVSAISGIKDDINKVWVGIAPDKVDEKKWKNLTIENKEKFIPVFTDNKLYKKYYNGISNDVIWPIFHYEASMNFKWENWTAYEKVNMMIAEKISSIVKSDDIIWIHDFHLFLVPKYLRRLNVKNRIGFFLHIPFPSSEFFKQIPARKEILEGVLESDLIGFHDYSYLKHFCSSVKSILDVKTDMLTMNYKGRTIHLGVFPVSIDTEKFIEASKSEDVAELFNQIQSTKNYKYLILGIDRLDYIKGLLIKMESFRYLLKNYPELVGNVSLLQITVPSREDVGKYSDLKRNLEKSISEINGEFSQPNYTPVQYIYSSIPFEKMIALYKAADILLVSSRRDGMNLVSFEYIASQDRENPGSLVLSEFTGAASILSEAIIINPWDTKGTADKIAQALKTDKEIKILKNMKMMTYLINYTASVWATDFINQLQASQVEKIDVNRKVLKLDESHLPMEFLMKQKIIIFIDYDGTLSPIVKIPEKALMPDSTKVLLEELVKDEKIEIVVVSGREHSFIERQLKDIDSIEIAAEHGAKFYSDKKWTNLINTQENKFIIAKTIMEDYAKRVPGSFIEEKEFSIVWHYRLSPEEFGEYQAHKMAEEIEIAMANLPVCVMVGKKIVEVKTIEADKGYFVNWYLKNKDISDDTFIIAIGDDTTDEDMFLSLKGKGLSIKVGLSDTEADYILKDQNEVYKFLSLINDYMKI